MKIMHSDYKKGDVKLLVESPEDYWELSGIIEAGDKLSGSTERKTVIGGETDRNKKAIRKKMTLSISVEKAEYTQDSLRVLGVIIDGPEDVPRGEHHSFVIEAGDMIRLHKEQWASWQQQKLKSASTASKEKILVVLFDRQEALFALLSSQGYKVLSTLKGNVNKKGNEEQHTGNFYKDIATQLKEYQTRHATAVTIAASPAFWKEYLRKEAKDLGTVVYATVSDCDESSLKELLKRPELKTALEHDRSALEQRAIEELLLAVAKEKAAYGIDDVEACVLEGSLEHVLVSDEYLMSCREKGLFERVDEILRSAKSTQAKILIITTQEASKTLEGLGGIAGVRRW